MPLSPYDLAAASLASNALQPSADPQQEPQEGPLLASYKQFAARRGAMAGSARPSPRGHGTPLAAAIQGARQQSLMLPAPTSAQGAPAYPAPRVNPNDPRVAAQLQPDTYASSTPVPSAGQTLGRQADGGRNVQLIRGSESEIQHFDPQGNNTGGLTSDPRQQALQSLMGELSPEQQKTGMAIAQAGGTVHDLLAWKKGLTPPDKYTPDFKRDNEQSIFQYDHLGHQIDRMGSQINSPQFQMMPAEQQQQLQQLHQQLHQQRDALGQKLMSWTPDDALAAHRERLAQADLDRHPAAQPRVLATGGSSYTMQDYQRDQAAKGAAGAGPQVPHPPQPGTPITPEAIEAISQVAKTREEAEQMAKAAGWSF